jgi:hypothetical protein
MTFTSKGRSLKSDKNRRTLNGSAWRRLLRRDWKLLFLHPTLWQ